MDFCLVNYNDDALKSFSYKLSKYASVGMITVGICLCTIVSAKTRVSSGFVYSG